jgi:hypothetical protein
LLKKKKIEKSDPSSPLTSYPSNNSCSKTHYLSQNPKISAISDSLDGEGRVTMESDNNNNNNIVRRLVKTDWVGILRSFGVALVDFYVENQQ